MLWVVEGEERGGREGGGDDVSVYEEGVGVLRWGGREGGNIFDVFVLVILLNKLKSAEIVIFTICMLC